MFPPLYDAHHQAYQDDLPLWQELASQHPGPILELGCGTGRVLIPLTAAGYPVTGLDRDFGMLAYLQQRARAIVGKQVPVFNADMSAFHLNQQFSLILMPCNTLSTLPAPIRLATFANAKEHLKSGGVLAVSLPNPIILNQQPRRGDSEVEDSFIHPSSGNPVQVSSAWERATNRFRVIWHYDHLKSDGIVERTSITVEHEILPADHYHAELRSSGLVPLAPLGDFDGSQYTEYSPHLILLASGE